MWKTGVFACLLLCACTSKPKSPSSAHQSFTVTHLYFDLDQEVTRHPCPIQGQIPEWLSGTLLRNGPAKFTVGKERVSSWFDGLAMLHAFEFSPQKVLYSNRFILSNDYYTMKEGKLPSEGFGQDPCGKKFQAQRTQYSSIVNADVNIADYADMMVALTEIPLPVVFQKETLDTVGAFDYHDDLPKSRIFESAHPQHDPLANETINYLVEFGKLSSYVIWKMKDHSAMREVLGEIPVDLPSYMHSFALTEHYVILAQFPLVVNPIDLVNTQKAFIKNYQWKPDLGTVFLVIERSTGKLAAKVKGKPFFAFHHVNAYDKDGKIYMDIVTYPDADVIEEIATTTQGQSEDLETTLERFTISVDDQTLSQDTIFSKTLEMPRIPASLTAQEYRYCYAVDHFPPATDQDVRPIYKIDVTDKTAKEWSQPGCFPGEPIFAPRPGGQAEDDGVVLTVVLDYAHHKSFLLILDGQSFTELARVEAPHAIPTGLHGYWSE